MAREKLTAVKVKNAPPGKHGDGDSLVLHVITAERRAWLFRYQRNGKRREMGLGGFPAVSLADARDKADGARKLLADGIDPTESYTLRQAGGSPSLTRGRSRMP